MQKVALLTTKIGTSLYTHEGTFTNQKAIFVLLILCVLIAGSGYAESNKGELRVGALVSLSGGLEQFGAYTNRGLQIAASESGDLPVKLFVEDDKSCDKVATLSAATALINNRKVHVLLNWTGSTIPPIVGVAIRNKIPILNGAYDKNVAQAGEYVFGIGPNYFLIAPMIADFMIKHQGLRRIALISADDYWSQSYPELFKKQVIENGAAIVFEQTVGVSATDMRTIVLKIKQANADGVFAPLYANSLYNLVRQLRVVKFSGMINAADGIFEEDIQQLGEDAQGIYGAQIWVDNAELRQKVKERYGDDVSELQLGAIAIAYDQIKYVRDAAASLLRKGAMITSENLRQEFNTFETTGYTGKLAPGSPPKEAGEKVLIVRDGRLRPVD